MNEFPRSSGPGGPPGHGYNPHDPEELSAHVLGLLDPRQAGVVEEHLASCGMCQREWDELHGTVSLLGNVPPEAFLDGPPPDADLLLQRTLRQVRSESGGRRWGRRIALVGAAAVALTAVLAGGVVIGREFLPVDRPAVTAAPAPGTVVLTGGGGPGVMMSTTLTPANGWVRLSTTVGGLPPGERCYIVVIGRDGDREIAGSWVVGAGGGGKGPALEGAAIIPLDQVDAVVVENDQGREFARAEA